MTIIDRLAEVDIEQRHEAIRKLLEQGTSEVVLASAIYQLEQEARHARLTEMVDQLQRSDPPAQAILAGQLLRYRDFLIEWLQTANTDRGSEILTKMTGELARFTEASHTLGFELCENTQVLADEVFEHLYALAYPLFGTEPPQIETPGDSVFRLIEIETDAMIHARLLLQSFGPGCANVLQTFLSDPDPLFRRACIWMLSRFGLDDVMPSLRLALADCDIFVRGTAALTIKKAFDNSPFA